MGNAGSFLGGNKKRRVVKAARISTKKDVNVIQESVAKPTLVSLEKRQDCKEALEVFPEAVWKRILENVTDSNDIFALLHTSPYFNKKMKEQGLLSLVLPHMMKSGSLDLKSTLECRLLSTATKAEVDKTFSEINEATKPHVLNKNFSASSNNPYFFDDVEKLGKFIEHFKECPVLSGNPFITNHLEIQTGNDEVYEKAVDLLARFGDLVRKLEFKISYVNSLPTLLNRLIRALNHVPNLEHLIFIFQDFLDDRIDIHDGSGVVKSLEIPKAFEFPSLPHLVNIELIDMNKDSCPNSSLGVARSILEKYGNQINHLKCGDEMLGRRIPVEFFSNHLNNLARLTLSAFDLSDNFSALGTLATGQFPNLKSLSLEFMDTIDGIYTLVPTTLVQALNNLRNSLEELHFWHRGDGRMFQFMGILPDPTILVLPKLKRLSLEPPDLYSNLWNLFTAKLRNLEYLELRARQYSGIVGIIHHLPEPRLIQNYFIRFPLLRSFVWKDLMDDSIRKTVITRLDARKEEKMETVRQIPYLK